MRDKNIFKEGFTLLEVLIALLIFSIGVLGVVTMQVYAVKTNAFSNDMTKGIEAASDAIERLMFIDYDNDSLKVSSPVDSYDKKITDIPGFNKYSFSGVDGVFNVKEITKISDGKVILKDTKEITIKITWNNNKNLEMKFARTKDDSI